MGITEFTRAVSAFKRANTIEAKRRKAAKAARLSKQVAAATRRKTAMAARGGRPNVSGYERKRRRVFKPMLGEHFGEATVTGMSPKAAKAFMKAKSKKQSGMIARMLKEYASKTAANPVAYGIPATALGLDLGMWGYQDLIKPVGEAMGGSYLGGKNLKEAGIEALTTEASVKAIGERSRGLRDSIRKNIQVIAESNPQLYNEIIAGKRLPRGAVVLGGPPRRDLLEEVATMMAGVQ
jgi:hypothetical protein